jgi:hypothetical protein
MGMIGEAAKGLDDRTAWLGHFLWLCDGDAGPDVPTDERVKPQSTETTTERFRIALSSVIARRLNMPEKEPIILAHGTREAAVRWTTFLREMEPRLPGISGAARNLIESLVFGLGQMTLAGGKKDHLPITVAGIEAFARFLVRRMANARAAILFSAEEAWKLRYKRKILNKLAEANLEDRHLHIPADTCRELLAEMERGRLVRVTGGKWERLEGASLSPAPTPIGLS